MQNKTINTKVIAKVAKALKELNNEIVFVGGAVISLYTDDPAADEIRPTGDIDLMVKLSSFSEWNQLNAKLLELGFTPNPDSKIICNYLYEDVEIDIMPSQDSQIGISNSWYAPGLSSIIEKKLDDVVVRLLSAPYFIATKFEAFHNRGKDYRTSHDFEDIIYVIDHCEDIVELMKNAEDPLKTFLTNEIKTILNNPFSIEIISAHIHPLMLEERLEIVLDKLNNIIS